MPGPAATIDEVIARLGDVIERSVRERSRLGFFAALYRKVTVKVKEGIAAGRFDDGPRMERLDVTFANRYLTALERFRGGQPPTPCWLLSFEAAATWPPIILQHLLLGMNAHINFDLGIAAATVSPRDELPSLKHDFNEINTILAGLVGEVQSGIDRLSPWIKLLDHIDPKADKAIVNFSMEKARAAAWRVAERLAPVPPDRWGPELAKLDLEVTLLGRLVRRPIGKLINLGLLVIRGRETSDVARVIAVLDETSTAPV
jgi:hypothetical protein